tara:strand:- start:93 stop:2363 length:2271 start_codon:yes stop_codon:yes gene_type:complete
MKYINIIILFLTFSFSQIQYAGSPIYKPENVNIKYITIDHNNLIDHDLHPMVLHYANEYSVDINIPKTATKIVNQNNTTFYLGIESEDAQAIAFHFNKFQLTNNSKMFIYDDEQSMYIGSFNSKNNDFSGEKSTSLVKGDKVVIELTVPNNEIRELSLNLSVVTHDFLDLINFHGNDVSERVDCNDNVACSSGDNWRDEIDGVVLVSGNGGVCSASLINNTNFDKTPYIMYAAHCNSGGSNTVYFNYQSYSCTGTQPQGYNSMSGTQNLWIGNFNNNDGALIRLNNNIPSAYDPYYNGWNKSSASPGNNVVGIHHPDGWIKKISYNATGMSSNGNVWEFRYNNGRVIPGSSGSPMFDSNKRIRGMASYIYTDYCSPSPDCYCSQTYYHGYAKFSAAWNYIDQYLDPLNTNETFIDGTRDGIIEIPGCTDPSADNYNPDATVDDGSCIYGSANLSFGSISGDTIQILIDNSEAIGGFQFTMTDNPNYVTLIGANGGLAEENGFQVSTSDLGIVIGFSLTGESIPSGSGVLTNLSYSLNGSGNTLLCIDDLIVSDTSGNPLLTSEDCTTVDFASGNASLTFGDINSNSISVYISSNVDISGFQFNVTDTPDLIAINGASGGLAEQYGFEVSTSDLGIVIGFSFSGDVIPAGDGLLTNISYNSINSGETELCISDTIISDVNGNGLLSSGDCIDYEISDVVLGDINSDSTINVQDVVLLINFILGSLEPNGSEYTAADLNSDGILNVQDVVILINVILS